MTVLAASYRSRSYTNAPFPPTSCIYSQRHLHWWLVYLSCDSNLGASQVNLLSLEWVPPEGEQSVVGGEVRGELDLRADGVPASNRGVAWVKRWVVDTFAFRPVKRIACEPVIPVTGLTFGAVWAVVAGLVVDVCAWQKTSLEAILGCLLLIFRREIVRVQKLVHHILILADTVREHANVVTVGVNAPLQIDHIVSAICCGYRVSSICPWLVVVDAHTRVTTAWARSANLGGIKSRPRNDWL